jgi:hypothetical protein
MENKEILIRIIMLELNQIPAVYLQNLWNIIHTFRENIPAKEEVQSIDNQDVVESNEEIWDNLLKDVNEQRQFSNQQMMQKIDLLFDFEKDN